MIREEQRRRLGFIALWVFAFGLVFHGYCYLNGNLSHDSLYSLYEESPELMLSVGRFLRPVYRLLRGSFTLPLVCGFLSLVFLTLSSFFLLDILGIRSKGLTILSCGILVGNSTVALMNATFLHDADAYALSLLLAVLGVWVSRGGKGRFWLSAVLYFCALGIYQAFIDCAIYLILMLALLELLEGAGPKQVYCLAFRRLLAVALAMGLYFLAARLVPILFGIQANRGYNTVFSLLELDPRSLWERLVNFFRAEAVWFCLPNARVRPVIFGVNVVFLLLGIYLVVQRLRRDGRSKAVCWAAVGIAAAMPIGMNVITLLSNLYHALTIYSFFLSYLLVFALAEGCPGRHFSGKSGRLARRLCGVLAAMLLFDSCVYAQELYLEKEMVSDATLSLFTRLVDRMERTEGYVVGETPIAIVGRLKFSGLQQEREGMPSPANGMGYSYAATYFETYEKYFHYYLGYPAVFYRGPGLLELEETEAVRQMPEFPADGSVRMVGDVLVVKFSQPFHEAEIF